MEHITGYHIEQKEPTAVTLGNFDGIHLGHRELIRQTKEYASKENLRSVVFTFLPHPMFVFQNRDLSALIMSPEEKEYAMERMDVDVYIEYPFTKEFASMRPEDFAEKLLFEKLNCKVLIVGENYKFGCGQKGNYALLKELGKKHGVLVKQVSSILYEGSRVSSTRIRNCLISKDIEKANRLLSTPYFILGEVIQGKQLGRTIGFPTINFVADKIKLFPPNGVYATRTVCDGKIYYGVTNVGCNPTVNGTFKVVETFLFDFQKIVYGKRLKTYFFKWIRDEQKFADIPALRQQLKNDEASAVEYFNSEEFVHWGQKY